MRLMITTQSCPWPVAPVVKQLGRELFAGDLLNGSKAVLHYYLDGLGEEGPSWVTEAGGLKLAVAMSIQHESAMYKRKFAPEEPLDDWDLVITALHHVKTTGSAIGKICEAIHARAQIVQDRQDHPAPPPDFALGDLLDLQSLGWDDFAATFLPGPWV